MPPSSLVSFLLFTSLHLHPSDYTSTFPTASHLHPLTRLTTHPIHPTSFKMKFTPVAIAALTLASSQSLAAPMPREAPESNNNEQASLLDVELDLDLGLLKKKRSDGHLGQDQRVSGGRSSPARKDSVIQEQEEHQTRELRESLAFTHITPTDVSRWGCFLACRLARDRHGRDPAWDPPHARLYPHKHPPAPPSSPRWRCPARGQALTRPRRLTRTGRRARGTRAGRPPARG